MQYAPITGANARTRQAHLRDVPRIVSLASQMRDESPQYRHLAFDAGKCLESLRKLVEGSAAVAVVLDVDGVVQGAAIGIVIAPWWSHERMAADLGVFVHPQYRSGGHGAALLKAYMQACRSSGAKVIHMGVSVGVEAERTALLYERLGLPKIGSLHEVPCSEIGGANV